MHPELSAEQPLRLLVDEVNQPPVLAAVPDQLLAKPGVVKVAAQASDADLPAQSSNSHCWAGHHRSATSIRKPASFPGIRRRLGQVSIIPS